MRHIGELLQQTIQKMRESKEKAENSLGDAFDVYMDDTPSDEAPEVTEGLERIIKDSFYAGAMAFMMILGKAQREGVPGAITKKMESVSEEIDLFAKEKVTRMMKDAKGAEDLLQQILGGRHEE